jgi:predicted lipoprotein with Yx(FWY)xxD motif
MNKQVSIMVVLLVVIVGIYWLSTIDTSNYRETGNTQESQSTDITVTPLESMGGVARSSSAEYLVDVGNMTLYVSIQDENPSGEISVSCDAACEETWPPYLLPEDRDALDRSSDPILSKMNLFTRADGRIQYAIGTQPLYRYAGDNKLGDMNGNGLGSWMAAKP